MSQLGVDGLRAERDAILAVFGSLSDDEWNAPSDCAGWAVRDVAAHMASTLHGVADPAFLADTTGGTEQAMEGPVEQRRARPIADVVEEYATYSGQVVDIGSSVQSPPISEQLLPMNDLGTHPMAILPDLLLFDAYCHLRLDILRPNGPIERPEPPRDEQRLRPTIGWMMAGIPWMNTAALTPILDGSLVFSLDGPGGGEWTLQPADAASDGRPRITEGAADDARATVHSTTHDFVIWATQRRPWRDLAKVEGDADYAAAVLGAVNVI